VVCILSTTFLYHVIIQSWPYRTRDVLHFPTSFFLQINVYNTENFTFIWIPTSVPAQGLTSEPNLLGAQNQRTRPLDHLQREKILFSMAMEFSRCCPLLHGHWERKWDTVIFTYNSRIKQENLHLCLALVGFFFLAKGVLEHDTPVATWTPLILRSIAINSGEIS
jgi:hypothetical protein